MSHESRYTLVRLHDGGETTGEYRVSIRIYGVYDILHTRPLETTAVSAETQWLTADDVIWKVFLFLSLFFYCCSLTHFSSMHQWNFKKVRRKG